MATSSPTEMSVPADQKGGSGGETEKERRGEMKVNYNWIPNMVKIWTEKQTKLSDMYAESFNIIADHVPVWHNIHADLRMRTINPLNWRGFAVSK